MGQTAGLESLVPRPRSSLVRTAAAILLLGLGLVLILLSLPQGGHKRPASADNCRYTDSSVPAPAATPPDSATVLAALARVPDPELGISIVDLGLPESISVDQNGNVSVVLALTVPGCPRRRQIGQQALAAITALPGVRRTTVRLDTTICWSRSRLTPAGRKYWRERFGTIADSAP